MKMYCQTNSLFYIAVYINRKLPNLDQILNELKDNIM